MDRSRGIEIVAKHVEAEEMTCDWTHRLADEIDDALALVERRASGVDVCFTLHVKTLDGSRTHVGAQELASGWRQGVQILAFDRGALQRAVALLLDDWWADRAKPGNTAA